MNAHYTKAELARDSTLLHDVLRASEQEIQLLPHQYDEAHKAVERIVEGMAQARDIEARERRKAEQALRALTTPRIVRHRPAQDPLWDQIFISIWSQTPDSVDTDNPTDLVGLTEYARGIALATNVVYAAAVAERDRGSFNTTEFK